MNSRDYILRMIEQFGQVAIALRKLIFGGRAGSSEARQRLRSLSQHAGLDLEMARVVSLDTLLLISSPGGDLDPSLCWMYAETLYLDALDAELSGDRERARDGYRKSRALYSMVAPLGAFLVGFPEAAERIGEIEARVSALGGGDGGATRSRRMRALGTAAILMGVALAACGTSRTDTPDHDPAALEAVLEDIRVGWEQGDGTPFYTHFLDWDGARYFEGGGENVGLRDLVENHVEPEAELGLRLGFSNIQTHFEGDFAWAVVDTDIQLTTPDGRDIHNRGHGTYLFRWVDRAWKVLHTQSASSPVRDD